MKKSVFPYLALLLIPTLITPGYASVKIQATISEAIHVVFTFGNLIYYEEIKNVITEFTIPEIILRNLEERNLTDVESGRETVQFSDTEKMITVEFYLSGSDILNFTFNSDTNRRRFRIRTDWRKFELNLANLSLDFREYFGRPLSDWNFENEKYLGYHYNYTGTVPFDPLCYFILPGEATEVHIAGDKETIVFELPSSLGESLLNSPFLILGAIIVAIIASSLYRSVRKREEQGSAS